MNRVKDKVIVITGAASGLGLADARALVNQGAKVVMTDIDTAAGQSHASDIGATVTKRLGMSSWDRLSSSLVASMG